MNSARTMRLESFATEDESIVRWFAAGAIVLLLHTAGAAAVLYWPGSRDAAGDPPPAVMIELAPVAVAPEPTPLDIAPGPNMLQAQQKAAPPKAEAPAEKLDLPEKPQAELQLPPPAPKEPEKEPRKDQPDKQPELQKIQKKAAPQTTAAPKTQVKRANNVAAPVPGHTERSNVSHATWRGAVMAQLNRYKRYPAAGTTGTAVVAFTIDPAGRVLSARLVRGAGNSALDAEAVSLVRRASPLPAPPPTLSNGRSLSLTVPVRFGR